MSLCTFCVNNSCSQIDLISTLKCQEIEYTIFDLPLNHNLRCYLVSHVSGNFRLEDKHRDDFSIVDDRAVTQGGHGTGCWGDGRGDRATETWNPNCQLKRPSFFQTFLPVICFRWGWKCLNIMLIINVIPFVGFCSSQPPSITCLTSSSFVSYGDIFSPSPVIPPVTPVTLITHVTPVTHVDPVTTITPPPLSSHHPPHTHFLFCQSEMRTVVR